jgi:iron complex outermembrane receptor protein
VNYNLERQNFQLRTNYTSGVDDERGAKRTVTPGGTVANIVTTDFGVEGKDWLSFDFTYLFDVTDYLRLTASVNNILDKAPPRSPQELGYDPLVGSPLGRTFEITAKATF